MTRYHVFAEHTVLVGESNFAPEYVGITGKVQEKWNSLNFLRFLRMSSTEGPGSAVAGVLERTSWTSQRKDQWRTEQVAGVCSRRYWVERTQRRRGRKRLSDAAVRIETWSNSEIPDDPNNWIGQDT